MFNENFDDYKNAFDDTLSDFDDMGDGPPGRIKEVQHRFELTSQDIKQIHSAQYQAGTWVDESVREEVDKMVITNVFERAQTKWAAPNCIWPMNYVALRFCIQYWCINDVTFRDSYPSPARDKRSHSLRDTLVFLMLRAKSGFWQV